MTDVPGPTIPRPWRAVSADSLPSTGQLVLLRMKNAAFLSSSKRDSESLLTPGNVYGFVLAVIKYQQDGFGSPVPMSFQQFRFKRGTGSKDHELEVGGEVPFNEVHSWLAVAPLLGEP